MSRLELLVSIVLVVVCLTLVVVLNKAVAQDVQHEVQSRVMLPCFEVQAHMVVSRNPGVRYDKAYGEVLKRASSNSATQSLQREIELAVTKTPLSFRPNMYDFFFGMCVRNALKALIRNRR